MIFLKTHSRHLRMINLLQPQKTKPEDTSIIISAAFPSPVIPAGQLHYISSRVCYSPSYSTAGSFLSRYLSNSFLSMYLPEISEKAAILAAFSEGVVFMKKSPKLRCKQLLSVPLMFL